MLETKFTQRCQLWCDLTESHLCANGVFRFANLTSELDLIFLIFSGVLAAKPLLP